MPYVGGATAVTPSPVSSTVNSIAVTVPAEVEAGDDLLLFAAGMSMSTGLQFTTPAGWEIVIVDDRSADTSSRSRFVLYRKTATETDAESSVTLVAADSRYLMLRVMAYRDETITGQVFTGTKADFIADVESGATLVLFVWGTGLAVSGASNISGLWPPEAHVQMYGASPALTFMHAHVAGPVDEPAAEIAIQDQASTGPIDNAAWWVANGSIGEVIPPAPPEPLPGGPLQASGDRLRSSISESVGSLLESVEARAVDARAGEDFTNAQWLDPAVRTVFREVTTARDGPPDFSYYPRPKQNSVEENQYDGITVLSRLTTWFPPTMFDTVVNLGIVGSGAATAQEVVQYVLDSWAALVPWLTVGTVPDLRLRKEFYAPASYGPTDGLVTTETLTIDQSGENRKDALSVLHDLLSPFPGTIVRGDSAGVLQVVPIYGPDADSTPALTLGEDWDLYSVSRGRPDPFSVKNRVTVTNQSSTRTDETALMQPAWFQIGSNYQLGLDTWFTPPNDRLNLQPPYGSDDTLQESLLFGQFSSQLPASWPMASSSIAAGEGISLRDGSNNATITCAWRRYAGSSLEDSGTGTLTLIEDEIPFDGVYRDTFKFDQGSQTLTIRCRWDAVSKSVQFALGPGNLESGCINGCRGWVVEFTLNDSSVGYATGASKSVTFGVVEDGDSLPSEAGGNAITESQTALGILEASIDIRGYDLDLTTLSQIARAYVLQNITPRVTRDIELSSVGSRVTFDHMGRLVELPGGEQGYVVAVEYADEFTAGSWSKTAQVQIANTDADGAVPDTDIYYLDSNGEAYMSTVLTLPGGAYEVTDDA